MSRTDAHRPYRGWLADHPELAVAVHRHGGGACDLPEDRAEPGTRCTWELSAAAPPLCCCQLCHCAPWNREDVKRRRQRDRVLLRRRPLDPDDWAVVEARLLRH